MADIRGGEAGQMPLEYLYSAMQMEKYSGAAPPLHRGGFIYIMHCPSSVSVCILSTELAISFSFPLFFLFCLFLRFSPIFIQNSFCSLSLSSLIRSRRACTYLARNNDSVIGSANGANTKNLFLAAEFPR